MTLASPRWSNEPATANSFAPTQFGASRPRLGTWRGYLWGISAAAAITSICCVSVRYLELADVTMIFLLGVVVLATRVGIGPSLVAAVLGVVAFDYFVIPPVFHFRVTEFRHLVTLAGVVIAAAVVSGLTEQLRRERERAKQSAERTHRLYSLERELSGLGRPEQLAAVACRHLGEIGGGQAMLVPCPVASATLSAPGAPSATSLSSVPASTTTSASVPPVPFLAAPATPLPVDDGLLRLVAASGTAVWPQADASSAVAYLPLISVERVIGVIAIRAPAPGSFEAAERDLIEACCRQLAFAMERLELTDRAERARLQVETERIRSSLLSTISHDVRTPIALISASTQMLIRNHAQMDPGLRSELLTGIAEHADRLDALLRNVIAMTRAEAGSLGLHVEPGALQEVLSGALRRSARVLGERAIEVRAPRDLPMVSMDASLLEQVFVNLLENAARYSPAGSPIVLDMASDVKGVRVRVEDRGPGVPDEELERVFDKFYRGSNVPRNDLGIGLGLSICRAIVTAHGGTIRLDNREGGGLVAEIVLPAHRLALNELSERLPELS